jgi:hypothetical protein
MIRKLTGALAAVGREKDPQALLAGRAIESR